jgi:hypothetical protein
MTSRDRPIIDQRSSDLCSARVRASGLPSAKRVAVSTKKVRCLSENPGNLLTKANAGQVTVEGKSVLV